MANYSRDEEVLIALSQFVFLYENRFHALIKKYNNPQRILEAIINREQFVCSILNNNQITEIIERCSDENIKCYLKNLEALNIICSTYLSDSYPKLLKETPDFPIVLYLKGDISLLKKDSVAIVGTRNPTNYGRGVTHSFSKNLARAGLVIVSGMSTGVDKIAHEACLEVGGKTIAVLGGGFNKIYPAVNYNLSIEISKKGLLVSEYAPSAFPQRYTFPARNRIIAGLSLGTLITEASEKSGSLYTKEYAIDYNRNLYLVPGNITSSMSMANNKMIKSCQGMCVISYEDILNDLGYEGLKKETAIQLGINERMILDIVEKEETHFDVLLSLTNLEPKILNSCLTTMCIRGIIRKLPGNFYSV